MNVPTSVKRRSGGFTLIELLVVIAVIGLIASIAVASMSNVNENSPVVAAKSQAQQIAATFSAGQATGAPGFKMANNVESGMNAVGTGSIGAGVQRTSFFQVKGVSSAMDEGKPVEQQAKHYLRWSNGSLIYDPTGSRSVQNPPPPDVQ